MDVERNKMDMFNNALIENKDSVWLHDKDEIQ